jgi:hypothetical protein
MTRLWRWYCRNFHGSPMYAGGKEYECRRCRLRWVSPTWYGPAPRQGEGRSLPPRQT